MRYFYLIIISALSIIILWINIKLHSENYSKKQQKEDIIKQLNFLEKELKENYSGERMQKIFPEGYVFIHALYGLSWCELTNTDPNDFNLKKRAIKESIYALDQINSDKAKWTFEGYLKPEYGIFYSGWKNYLLSKILSIDTSFSQHKIYINLFKAQCDSIANALKANKSPYIESYSHQSWPADMFVAMASLSNHDKIFKPKYNIDIDQWLQKVKENLDTISKMVPHKVDSKTGKAIEGTRGSSMGLILRMLGEINSEFGKEQFDLYKSNFISTTFGLPSIREYPSGQDGYGDVDSGPVILGVGFSATIVSIGTLSIYDHNTLANNQYKTIHAFGLAIKSHNQKRYLLGKLPMADAFITWGRASGMNTNNVYECSRGSFIKFHSVSFLALLVIWSLFYQQKIRKLFKKNPIPLKSHP